MAEEDQNSGESAQALYQRVLSNTKNYEANIKGLVKHIVDNVSEFGETDIDLKIDNTSFRPGAGYKADAIYSFLGKNITENIRDDDSMRDSEALEEAVSNFKYFVRGLDVSFSWAGSEAKLSVSGPILEKPLGEYEEVQVTPQRDISAEDKSFLDVAKGINLNWIRKNDIPKMREALQERFPNNYESGQKHDLYKVRAREVISEFKKKLNYIRKREDDAL